MSSRNGEQTPSGVSVVPRTQNTSHIPHGTIRQVVPSLTLEPGSCGASSRPPGHRQCGPRQVTSLWREHHPCLIRAETDGAAGKALAGTGSGTLPCRPPLPQLPALCGGTSSSFPSLQHLLAGQKTDSLEADQRGCSPFSGSLRQSETLGPTDARDSICLAAHSHC